MHGRLWHDENADIGSSPLPTGQKSRHEGPDNVANQSRNSPLTPRHDEYTIAWICALYIEMAAARAMLDDTHETLPIHAHDSNNYVLGSIEDHNVVIACLPTAQYGTNNAANVVTHLRRTFPSIRLGLMVGIGGGVPSMADIRLGDIVVGTRVMQCDLGKIIEDGKLQRTAIPKIPPHQLGTAVSTLRSKHELEPTRVPSILREKLKEHPAYGLPSSPDRLFYTTYDHGPPMSSCDTCDLSKLVPRSERRPGDVAIHYGGIASSNQVMRSGITRDEIARNLDIICFEMETAGLMDVLPCLPIRGICDYSDSHKSKEWQRYAAATAAAYARELLEIIPVTEACTKFPDTPVSHQNSLHRERLMKSLEFDQIDARKSNIETAHAETCRWFLSHPDYQAWLNEEKLKQHHGFLWISGKPGAGKSTIMKFAYLNTKKRLRGLKHTVASFFFNARGADLEKSVFGMYRSLLLQLLQGYPDLQIVLDDPDLISPRHSGCPSLNVLKDLLHKAVSALGKQSFTCFIDALDESDEQQVMDMVQYFEGLAKQSTGNDISFRVCFSSRHYPYIIIERGIRLTLEDQPEHAKDLANYVANRLQIKDRVLVKELLGKASGVFLWVVLVVKILNKEYRRGGLALRKRLAEIPSGLSELFRDILKRDSENMESLLLCILWILCAKRPLEPEEFYHGLWSGLSLRGLVDPEIPAINAPCADNTINRFIISSSKGLAEITKSVRPTVQFFHESVQDFFVKERGLQELWPDIGFDWKSPSHERLKECCNSYIHHTVVRTSIAKLLCATEPSGRPEVSKAYPFLEYASQHILYHANAAAEALPQDKFLSSVPVADWIGIANLFEFDQPYYNLDGNLFYLLADKGFARLIHTRLKVDQNAHVFGDIYEYPLFAALAKGNKGAAAALLNLPSHIYNGVDIMKGLDSEKDLKEYKKKTPLSWAAQNGRASIAKLLLQVGAAVNAVDRGGRTPLLRASENGHKAVVQLLLEEGADIETRDRYNSTPLLKVAENGHEAVAHLLLEKGADIEGKDQHNRTPLLQAAENGHGVVFYLLLQNGADIEAKDRYNRTPLSWAAQNGHGDIVQLLLEKGADIETKDRYNRTPLSCASGNGQGVAAELLLGKGANIDAIDSYGRTSLLWAVANGYKAVIQLLLERGAYIEAKDNDGRTSLSWAAGNGRKAVIQLLLKYGADIEAKDNNGQTPLLWATKSVSEAVQGRGSNMSEAALRLLTNRGGKH